MTNKKVIKIRFNTENKGSLFWRAIIEGQEHLADLIDINVPTYTTEDVLPDGRIKWHITGEYDEVFWDGTKLTVK